MGRPAQRADHRRLPVRHPRGPAAPRARPAQRVRRDEIRVIARHLPPRHFKLSYLVTAWTQRPEDEHRLLSSLLTCFLRYDALPADAAHRTAGRARAAGPGDGRPAAAGGPGLRRRLVGARRRAQAVDRRGGQRAGRHRPAVSRPDRRSTGAAAGQSRAASTAGRRPSRPVRAAADGAGGAGRDARTPARRRAGRPSRSAGQARPAAGRRRGAGRTGCAARAPAGGDGRTQRPESRRRSSDATPDRRRRQDSESRPVRSADPEAQAPAAAADRGSRRERRDLAYLLGRAELVEDRVRELVPQRRADDPAPDDPFRGLYLSDETVDRLLDRGSAGRGGRRSGDARGGLEAEADAAEAAGAALRLRRLARDAGLTAARRRAADDRAAARSGHPVRAPVRLPQRRRHPAPRLGRAGPAAGRRLGDVGRGPGSAGAEPTAAAPRTAAWSRTPTDRSSPAALRVPDRVAAHLLGDDAPDPAAGRR